MYVENPEVKYLTSMTVYKGWTIATMTVYCRCSSRDTWKIIVTLRRGVSDHHDGYARQVVEGITVRRCFSVGGHLEKVRDPEE